MVKSIVHVVEQRIAVERRRCDYTLAEVRGFLVLLFDVLLQPTQLPSEFLLLSRTLHRNGLHQSDVGQTQPKDVIEHTAFGSFFVKTVFPLDLLHILRYFALLSN